jgi:alanyl-tRNA synthetase
MQSFQIMLESTLMSERAYYKDSYTNRFKAVVIERLVHDGRPALILDRTYFYPTSGGQPCDLGKMNDVSVVDVLVHPQNGDVLHILENEVSADQVKAVIDWQRRFDHMQHHTGQHILSQAFVQIAAAETVGFHLSPSSVTIDLDKNSLSQAQREEAEQLANEIIWQNRPVKARTVNQKEIQSLPLRKIPPARDGRLRLIEIADFDLTACGGTHVARTGEIGLLKIIKQEKRGEKLRIEFRCGHRALLDYQQKHQIVTQLTTQLTTGANELSTAVVRLQADNKQSHRQLKKTARRAGSPGSTTTH